MNDQTKNEPLPYLTTLSHAAADPFRLLVEAANDYCIFMLDPAGNVASWNTGAKKSKGYSAEEIIGKHFSCFYTAEELAAGRPHEGLKIALEQGHFEEEGLRLRKAGAPFWAIVTITAIYDFFGQHVGFANITRDITERKKSEDGLQASEERFRLLVEGLSDHAIIMLEPTGTVASWNKGAERITGRKAIEIIGQHFSCLFSTEDVTDCKPQRQLQRAVAEGKYEGGMLAGEERRLKVPGNIVISALFNGAGTLRGFATVTRDVTERNRAETFRLIVESVKDYAIFMLDTTGHVSTWNAGAERCKGYRAKDIIGQHFSRLYPIEDVRDGKPAQALAIAKQTGHYEEEGWRIRKDGSRFWANVSITALYDALGEHYGFAKVTRDVTERRRLEEQLRQSQKMEAFGQLAGGVVHDFNNLLTIISGYSELVLGMLPPDDCKKQAIMAISEAGEQAAGLTRQILSFSRLAVIEPKVLGLNDIVKETVKLLRRMLGEDIVLKTVLDPNIGLIKVDSGQIGQVLMNLAVNAQDAMPQGGELTIATSSIQLDEADVNQNPQCRTGRYINLLVSDTGCGMPPEVKARSFEPFSTTKEPGKGTGLGLATVHGIIKQSGGSISLYSEPGHGTTFKIHLPAVDELVHLAAYNAHAGAVAGGSETVLLVEDEEAVRAITFLALQMYGYNVLQAASGKNALAICEKHPGRIDLLVTDVVMPGMSGRELADTLCPQFPGLRLLYLSGYTNDAVIRHGILEAEVAFLHKPYTPLALARKVRQVLDVPQNVLGSNVI